MCTLPDGIGDQSVNTYCSQDEGKRGKYAENGYKKRITRALLDDYSRHAH